MSYCRVDTWIAHLENKVEWLWERGGGECENVMTMVMKICPCRTLVVVKTGEMMQSFELLYIYSMSREFSWSHHRALLVKIHANPYKYFDMLSIWRSCFECIYEECDDTSIIDAQLSELFQDSDLVEFISAGSLTQMKTKKTLFH